MTGGFRTKIPINLFFLCAAVVSYSAVYAPAAFASQQEPPAGTALRDLSFEQLGSLEVTIVSKQPEQIWRSAAAIFVLTREEIRRSGLTSLPELLRLVPGVQVSRLDSDHWAVAIRGLTSAFSKSLLVLIDGRSVYTPLFGGVFWQTQDTPVEDIERIEVIRGPGGTIWGANAVNGVINVITRRSDETHGLLASVGGGNVDHGRAVFRYGGHRGDAFHYRVYGSAFSRDALHHSDNHYFDKWHIAQAGFRTDATVAGGTLTTQGDIYKGRAGDRLAVGSFFPPSRLLIEGDDRVSGGNVLARWVRDVDGGSGVRLQAYFDRTDRRAIHFAETRNTFDVDFLHHAPLGSRHRVAWGLGARVSAPDFTPLYPTLSIARPGRSHRFVSVFAQDEIELAAESLWLTVGSKFEHNNNTGWEVQPSVRLLWMPEPHASVWTSVTRAVRTPSTIDTDIRLTGFAQADPPAFVLVKGSENFRSERLIGFEAGYRRLLGGQLYLDVTAFHNDYDHLAGFGALDISVPLEPIPHVLLALSYENAIEGTTNGFEIAPDWKPGSWLQLRGGYAFLRADMRSRQGFADEGNVALYEDSSPRHQGFLRASLTLPHEVEIDYTHRIVSRLRSHEIPRYNTADARVAWQFSKSVGLAVAMQNLVEANHVEFFRDDVASVGMRRSIFASLTWGR